MSHSFEIENRQATCLFITTGAIAGARRLGWFELTRAAANSVGPSHSNGAVLVSDGDRYAGSN